MDATDIEKPVWSNSLTPSDAMLQEFSLRYGNLASNAAELSESQLHFGYVPNGSESQRIFSVFNNSERLNLMVSVAGLTN